MYLYQIHSQEQFIARERASRRGGARRALRGLSDARLISQLEKLRGEERSIQLEILYYLSELEHRRLYLPRGYSSLFEFCTGRLGYARSAAVRRINAARCIERFPDVAQLLLSGRLSLTAVSMISKILTRENAAEILRWSAGKSTRDIEALISRHQPGRIERDRVKPISVMLPVQARTSKCQADLTSTPGAGSKCKANLTSDSSKLPNNKPDTENTGQNGSAHGSARDEGLERVVIKQKYRLEFAVEPEFMLKLEHIQSLLSTKYPKGLSLEELFTILMEEYIERNSPQARAARKNRRKMDSASNKNDATQDSKRKRSQDPGAKMMCMNDSDSRNRHISKALKDKVYTRDKGRCTYVAKDGKRCNSRWNLQVDHIVPYARGGKHTLDNLRLLCARHNGLEAERVYGKTFMKQYAKKE